MPVSANSGLMLKKLCENYLSKKSFLQQDDSMGKTFLQMNVLEIKSNLDFNTIFNFQTEALSEHRYSTVFESELSTVLCFLSLQCPS